MAKARKIDYQIVFWSVKRKINKLLLVFYNL